MIWFYEAIGSIRDFMELGGNVLWAIMFVLFLMWTFILERLWYFYRVYPVRRDSILTAWESRSDTTSWYARRIRQGLVSESSLALRQNVGLIKVLIAICPLLGLLGTVTGMIATFQMITLFGTGDPRMMAGGISTALVTTVLGLVVAIPLTLLHSFLQGKAKALIQVLEEQAAGMIARVAEQRA